MNGNKILQNAKTHKIYMLSLAKIVRIQATFSENRSKQCKIGYNKFDLILDVHLIINLACLLPWLEIVHVLIKISQK
jgi:hypothetical protein